MFRGQARPVKSKKSGSGGRFAPASRVWRAAEHGRPFLRIRGHMSYPTGTNLISSAVAPAPKPRLLDEVRRRLRVKHYSVRTEKAYVGWIRRFILANGKRHPREMGAPEVEAFLTGLAVEGDVAASTQNQALSALLFLYREVLAIDLPWLEQVTRAKKPRRLPLARMNRLIHPT